MSEDGVGEEESDSCNTEVKGDKHVPNMIDDGEGLHLTGVRTYVRSSVFVDDTWPACYPFNRHYPCGNWKIICQNIIFKLERLKTVFDCHKEVLKVINV